ncbi:MAG: tetratricopeptide repeat protein [Sandaracinaceae bacterium]
MTRQTWVRALGRSARLASLALAFGLPVAPGHAQDGQDGAAEGDGTAEEGSASGAARPGWPTSDEIRMPEPGGSLSDLPPPPWARTEDVPNPEFLDTTDRRIQDDRPPPTAEQLQALRELEAEVDRFARSGQAYRANVNSILRREFMRRRREREAGYARQIAEEERLMNEARLRAIELLEAFIARYPNDPTHTPDAMFRLGELYYERSALEYQDATEQAESAGLDISTPDFTPTIQLYETLVTRFPDYRNRDGVYYLIGYCLQEMERREEALRAWLHLVCANRYAYDPGAPTEPEGGEGGEEPVEEGAPESPAATLDAFPAEVIPAAQNPADFTDPYVGCQPVLPNARFVNEIWLRIGEHHFSYDNEDYFLDRAISAYAKLLEHPEDRNYNLALYKLAWTYYRASGRYPQAVEHFWRLIDWSDEQERLTGRAGTELRQEALTYLGISFGYLDWDENQTPDREEGGPTPLQRVTDPNLMPQDRPWTVEVYFELGQILFDDVRYAEAIEVWEMALARFPNHFKAPEITRQVARAHQREGDLEQMRIKLGELARNFGPETQWAEENLRNGHVREVTEAERLAEAALVQDAVWHHEQAQELRQQAQAEGESDPERALELFAQAQAEYNLAAESYRNYLSRYPNSPQAYDFQFYLAESLYWSDQYEEAARAYAAVRDSNLDDTHLSEAARRVVVSLQRLVEEAERTGALAIRTEAPDPVGNPPVVQPEEMPLMVQRLAQARELYIARVSEEQDRAAEGAGVRAAYDYNNALLLYRYGYWPQARERFLRIYEERCEGENADPTGEVAWESLSNMAIAVNDRDEVERLALDLQRRGCTFERGAERITDENREDFCANPENQQHPQCAAGERLSSIEYARAQDVYRRAEQATGEEQRALFEQAATMLVNAVNEEPDHEEAPIALLLAAQALERSQRNESAGRLYQRVIEQVGPIRTEDPERQAQLDNILGTAYFRLAYTANRFFDYDQAVDMYRTIADSERFERSDDPAMPERITDSLINAARILEYQQQYSRAATYYRRAAEVLPADEARAARYRAAEMAFKEEDWNRAVSQMRSFIRQYEGDGGAAELVVTAYYRIAQARQRLRQNPRNARRDVVNAFARTGAQPGSIAAEYAAESHFALADTEIEDFEDLRIAPGRQRTDTEFLEELNDQIQDGARRAEEIKNEYEPVLAYQRPAWTVAAYARQGRVYEVLARAVLDAQLEPLPTNLERALRPLPPFEQDELRFQFEEAIRAVIDQEVRPIECLALVRYALAARLALAASIDSEYSRQALDRLQAYGEERINECLTQPQFAEVVTAPRPGEFVRARRGQLSELPAGLTPPPVARPNED